jgi:Tripeptidyl peptidase II
MLASRRPHVFTVTRRAASARCSAAVGSGVSAPVPAAERAAPAHTAHTHAPDTRHNVHAALTPCPQIYQLILEYNFNQAEAGEVTLRLPLLNGVLYESALEAQMVLLFDANKRLLGASDAWPSAIKCKEVRRGNLMCRALLLRVSWLPCGGHWCPASLSLSCAIALPSAPRTDLG